MPYRNEADKKLAAAIVGAKKLLSDRTKWSRDALARDDSGRELKSVTGVRGPNAVTFCAIGAVMRCGGKKIAPLLDLAVFRYTSARPDDYLRSDEIVDFNDRAIDDANELMPVYDIALDILRERGTTKK